MASLNKVFLIGNLTRKPEIRYTPGGSAVCETGLAINRKFTSNGQEREETCFVDIVVWGKQGESCSRYLEKGSMVMVEGRLQFDQWEDRETGKKRSRLRVVADRVQFIGGRGGDSGGAEQQSSGYNASSQQQGYQAPTQGGYQAPPAHGYRAPAPPPASGAQPPAFSGMPPAPEDAFNVEEDAEDDIPF